MDCRYKVIVINVTIVDERISSIVAGSLEHTVPSLGYVLVEKTLPGSLDANAVKVNDIFMKINGS